MANTRNESGTQTPKSGGRAGQPQDKDRQWHGNQQQDEDVKGDRDDNVEVGDPVPENERTIRASRDGQGLSNGQGETGEDEGLSGDAGDGERH
jgi:hypothetical protein